MIRFLSPLLLLYTVLAACGSEPPPAPPPEVNAVAPVEAPPPEPPPPPRQEAPVVEITIETGEGPITVALDVANAPVTATNFLRYVDARSFDDTFFYRAAPTPNAPGRGFIQGGIRRASRMVFPPIRHEPTSETGLSHSEGTISMARTAPGTAMAEFVITASEQPSMDARGGEPGYAAFGRVTRGMDTVRRILAAPPEPGAGRGAMRGQMIAEPVPIVSVRRVVPLDGEGG